MKGEIMKKSNKDISTLICCSAALTSISCLIESPIAFKFVLLISAVILSIYSVYLSLKRKDKNNVEESSDKTIEE